MDPAVWAQHSDFAVPRTGTKFEEQETRNIFEAFKKKESVDSKIIANNYADSVMRSSTDPIKFHLASDIVYFIHFFFFFFYDIHLKRYSEITRRWLQVILSYEQTAARFYAIAWEISFERVRSGNDISQIIAQ